MIAQLPIGFTSKPPEPNNQIFQMIADRLKNSAVPDISRPVSPTDAINMRRPNSPFGSDQTMMDIIAQRNRLMGKNTLYRGSFGDNEPEILWFTNKKDNAVRFGKDAKARSMGQEYIPGVEDVDESGINISSGEVSKGSNILDTSKIELPKELKVYRSSGGIYPGSDRDKIVSWAKQNGYDAVKFKHSGGNIHTAIINKSIFKSDKK